MNRRAVSNTVVTLASLLAETNAEADAELAQADAKLAQVGARLARQEPVMKAVGQVLESARNFAAGIHPAGDDTTPISNSALAALFAAIKACGG